MVELMAVVVIMGVLAVVGMLAFRQHIHSAKSTEATAMVQSIRAAEERWRSETTSYLDVSGALTNYYPMTQPGTDKHAFYPPGDTRPLAQRWALLKPTAPPMVRFGYAVVAGPPGKTPPDPATAKRPAWGVPNQNWYVIQAVGDVDGNGKFSYYVASSFTGEVYWENEGE